MTDKDTPKKSIPEKITELQDLLDNSTLDSTSDSSSGFSEDLSNSESAYIDENSFLEGRRVGKYRVTKNLGSGSYSKVKLGLHLDTGEKVAIKIVKRESASSTSPETIKRREERIYREALISSLMCHPHIVRLKNFFFNKKFFFLIFEYVNGEQLLDVISNVSYLPEKDARRYFRQILSAVSYIHENSIVHRDLKIENILIDEYGNARLLDFGLSNFYDNKRFLTTFCGSLYFAAPELLMANMYKGPEIDVWSLGIILYVLLCGRVPFEDKNSSVLHQKIKEAKLNFSSNISKDAKELLQGMICANPASRFDLKKVIESKWVNKKYATKVENFLSARGPIKEVDDKLVKILATITKDQFPSLKLDIEKYAEASVTKISGFERNFWLHKPSINLYYLLLENFELKSSESPANQYIDKNDNQKDEEESKLDDKSACLHNFVNFLFAKEKENPFSQYFTARIFSNKSDSIVFQPENEQPLREEFKSHEPTIIVHNENATPKIKNSCIKGIFGGIQVKNHTCQDKLRKAILDCCARNQIGCVILDRHYMCSYGTGNNYISFKISLYLNIILNSYYLSITRVTGEKKQYKKIRKIFSNFSKDEKGF